MSYIKKIEIYKILNSDFVTPLSVAPKEKNAKYINSDFIFLFDDQVWVRNRDNEDEYALAIYSPEFVRLNTMLFEKVR